MDMRRPAHHPVVINYPQETEVITFPDYTLRFGVSEAAGVEVSIDGGPWRACREALGYYWFDWGGYGSGHHEIRVRARLAHGGVEECGSRRLRVDL